MSTRKITFHILEFKKKSKTDIIYEDFDFESFMNWFATLDKQNKIFKLTENRFTSLDILEKIKLRKIENHANVYLGMMSTGIYGSRRHLKSSVDNSKRPNPKHLHEGEEQENYFILGFKTAGKIDMIFQNAGGGIKTLHIKNYLDKYINMYFTSQSKEKPFNITEGAVVDAPDKMIDRLDRIIKTKVFVNKSVLTDMGISTRTLQARHDIIIDVRARRGQDIRDILEDARQNLVHNTKVDKLWIEGMDNENNVSRFFLENIQKSTFVTIDVDMSTAAIVKDSIQAELLKLL